MTQITYNGVTLKDVLTRSIDSEVVYDPTNTDPLYVRVTVRAEVLINITNGSLGITLNGADIATATRSIIAALTMPRRRFTMTVGGKTLLDISPVAVDDCASGGDLGGTVKDIDNGPRPSFEIRDLISDYSMRGTFSCVMHVPACCGNQKIDDGNGIISIKWWQNDEVDENFYTTRTTAGRLIVASPLINIHALRFHCLPPLQGGFKRKSIHLSEDPGGKILDFRITDQQEYAAPPYPATKWTGAFTVAQPFAGDTYGTAECRVSLEGPPDISRSELILLAARILYSRMKIKPGPGASTTDTGALITNVAFTEHLHRNAVDAVAQAMIITGEAPQAVLQNIASTDMGKHLPGTVSESGYDPTEFPNGRATVGLAGLFVDALQTACSTNAYKLPNAEDSTATTPASSGLDDYGSPGDTTIQVTTATALPVSPGEAYSEGHKTAPYVKAEMLSSIKELSGKVRLPSGDDESSGSETTVAVALHQPAYERIIKLEMTRIGEAPNTPTPKEDFTDETHGITHTLLDSEIECDASGTMSDGKTTIYKLRMKLTYSLNKTPDLSKGLPYGNLPYRGNTSNLKSIQALFDDKIVF